LRDRNYSRFGGKHDAGDDREGDCDAIQAIRSDTVFYSSQKSPTRARATATAKYQGVDNKKRESNDHYLNPEGDPAQAPEGLVERLFRAFHLTGQASGIVLS
jgi:hypothetical protein